MHLLQLLVLEKFIPMLMPRTSTLITRMIKISRQSIQHQILVLLPVLEDKEGQCSTMYRS